MSIVNVSADGTCALPPGVKPGPYDLEVSDGVVTLYSLVRATDGSAPTGRPIPRPTTSATPRATARRRSSGRDYKGRSWSRVPAGTRMTGPNDVGTVTMGARGDLSNGRTPNQHLTDHGITANAWQVFRLADGRSVGAAYDMNEWP